MYLALLCFLIWKGDEGQSVAAGLFGDGSQILSAPRRYYQATKRKRRAKRRFPFNILTVKCPIKSQKATQTPKKYLELKMEKKWIWFERKVLLRICVVQVFDRNEIKQTNRFSVFCLVVISKPQFFWH